MLLFAHALALVALLSTPKGVPMPPDFAACAANATDIVVTDPEGTVLECWRGELKTGEVVRLGLGGLTPANALPMEWLRLRPDRPVSGFHTYRFYRLHQGSFYDTGEEVSDGWWVSAVPFWSGVRSGIDTGLRLVLFLRKTGTSGAGATWSPAAAPVREGTLYDHCRMEDPRIGRFGHGANPPPLPRFAACSSDDFTASVAFAEAGRVVAWQNGHWAPLALSADDFRADALARPAPQLKPVRWAVGPEPLPPGPAAMLLGGSR